MFTLISSLLTVITFVFAISVDHDQCALFTDKSAVTAPAKNWKIDKSV